MVMFYEDARASVFTFNAERWNDEKFLCCYVYGAARSNRIPTRRVGTSENP
jgi:hypothetical protein